jgi:hypothetical protein
VIYAYNAGPAICTSVKLQLLNTRSVFLVLSRLQKPPKSLSLVTARRSSPLSTL